MDMLHVLASTLNTSKIFSGFALIMMSIGSRYVLQDLGKAHETVMDSTFVKVFILFCMFFIGSRDVIISMIMTFAFFVIVYGLLHEKSKYSVIPWSLRKRLLNHDVSYDQYMKSKEIVRTYEAQKSHQK